jgi:hypothetical protein
MGSAKISVREDCGSLYVRRFKTGAAAGSAIDINLNILGFAALG